MSLKKNEVAINKAVSVKLDPETLAIVAYVYHTRNKEDPTDHSFYRHEVRVAKIQDLEAEIANMKKPENRLNLWRWPNSTWPADWFMGYDKSNDNAKGAKWLQSKIKKALDWPAFEALVKDGVKHLGNGENRTYAGAQYDTDDYQDIDGNQNLSILNPQVLISHLNKPLWKITPLKRDQKK